MSKYGHESGSIAISQLQAGIDDRKYISTKTTQIHTFSILTFQHNKYNKQDKNSVEVLSL